MWSHRPLLGCQRRRAKGPVLGPATSSFVLHWAPAACWRVISDQMLPAPSRRSRAMPANNVKPRVPSSQDGHPNPTPHGLSIQKREWPPRLLPRVYCGCARAEVHGVPCNKSTNVVSPIGLVGMLLRSSDRTPPLGPTLGTARPPRSPGGSCWRPASARSRAAISASLKAQAAILDRPPELRDGSCFSRLAHVEEGHALTQHDVGTAQLLPNTGILAHGHVRRVFADLERVVHVQVLLSVRRERREAGRVADGDGSTLVALAKVLEELRAPCRSGTGRLA